MKNPHRALEAIERLVGGDFGFDMENLLHNDGSVDKLYSVPLLRKTLKEAARIITEIYCISHSENEHSCNHSDWEEKKYEILKRDEE